MSGALRLVADFECANAENIQQIDDHSFSLHTRPDDAIDHEQYGKADYYAAFRLINTGAEPVEVTVDIHESDLIEAGRSLACRAVTDVNDPCVADWRPVDRACVDVDHERNMSTARLTVPGHTMLDVATMYWMSASQVQARLDAIAGDVDVRSLGTTAQGRSIPVADLSSRSPADAPMIMLGATPQGHELGTIAVMAVLEEALAGRLDDVLQRVRLVLLPLTNPDGNAMGNCMSNSEQRNVFFGFNMVGTSEAAIECRAVWDHVMRVTPACYVEMHSYPHLNRPSFRAYDYDLALFPDEASAARGKVFYDAVHSTSPNAPVPVRLGSDMHTQFGRSLTGRLVEQLGIPATIYKLHNRERIADNVAQAVKVVRGVAREMGVRR